ncbi:MAG: hypothetical protein K2M04_00705 [Muribaculaceae bacterium]|nr:hypothetical protein [Muribaculaceae bacterium]
MNVRTLFCSGFSLFVATFISAYASPCPGLSAADQSGASDATEFLCVLHKGEESVQLKSLFTSISENTDGSFTIADFANSGCPVTITVDDKAEVADGKYPVKIIGARVTESPGESYWIADAYVLDGSNLIDGTFYYEDETEFPVAYLCIILETEKESPLSFITKDGESASAKWYCRMLVRPYTDGFSLERDEYIEMSFALPNAPRSGIEEIEAGVSSDAPVIYYNLQGTKVDISGAAPGIYVRRQGNVSEKIVVR